MSNRISRNSQCPCGSGRKYESCCMGKVDWEQLAYDPQGAQSRFLSIRGKNLRFVWAIFDAIGPDKIEAPIDFLKLKRAVTPEAVRKIHEAIPVLWPDYEDFQRCMANEKKNTTALYTGRYIPETVLETVTRHSIYAERILLPDPFPYAPVVREEYNPLSHPEKYIANTVKWAFFWVLLYPWIEAGIVNFIRTPADFSPRLLRETIEEDRRRTDENPELFKNP